MTRIVVAGCGGRMGREIVSAATGDPEVRIVGGTVRPGTLAGRDFSGVAGTTVDGARASEELATLLPEADVVVDFTNVEATLANARAAAEARTAVVIGTTGLAAEQVEELRRLAERAPVLYSRNMSLGVNALLELLPLLARALADYDVEITEAHHRHKKDAPSGTALALGEAIAKARGGEVRDLAVHGREGIAPRQPGEIGFHAIRAGGNAGEHWVLFADEGEQIQVVHRAYSRRTFALGAVRAAKWLAHRPPGFYTMTDLLRG
ncbi:MAG TPA: 4-hydroxy-tetrahydrodipicolinate reductase [Chloroflexota bacterium]